MELVVSLSVFAGPAAEPPGHRPGRRSRTVPLGPRRAGHPAFLDAVEVRAVKTGWCKRAAVAGRSSQAGSSSVRVMAGVLQPGLAAARGVDGGAFVALPSRQAAGRVADAGTVPVLFDRGDLHRAVLPGSGLRVRAAALPADGLAPDQAHLTHRLLSRLYTFRSTAVEWNCERAGQQGRQLPLTPGGQGRGAAAPVAAEPEHRPEPAAGCRQCPGGDTVSEDLRVQLAAGTRLGHDGRWWQVSDLDGPHVLLTGASGVRRVRSRSAGTPPRPVADPVRTTANSITLEALDGRYTDSTARTWKWWSAPKRWRKTSLPCWRR
jgi:hypothetical protein